MSERDDTNPELHDVAGLLDFIGRAELRGHGISLGQMRNWVHREGAIPARHIPLFARLCHERGVELPLHLFNVADRQAPESRHRETEAA